MANHKSFMSSLNIPINEENCELSTLYWISKFQKNQYLDRYVPGSSTCSTQELSITMTNILHAVKGGLLSHCDKLYSRGNINQKYHICGVWLACSHRVRQIVGSSPGRVKPRTLHLVFVASPLNTQHYGERAKIGWLEIRIMCPNGMTFLPADCCFSELALYKSQHHHLIDN